MISIFIISFISVAMIVIVKIKHNIKVYRYTLEIFIASAVGALVTDAFIHLYPEALGIHSHDHHEHADHHDHNIYSSDNYIWKGIILISTLYMFYFFEFIMMIIPKIHGSKSHHHTHHHDHFHQSKISDNQNNNTEKIEFIKQNNTDSNVECNIICNVNDHIAQHRSHRGVPTECLEHMQQAHQVSKSNLQINPIENIKESIIVNQEPEQVCEKKADSLFTRFKNFFKMHKIVWMLTFGDVLHNCIDGFVIGTRFIQKWPLGFTKGVMTSIAILCHEVPHEIGDYAAMLATGMSIKKCILMNALSTISCFIGGLLGCGLGSVINTDWIKPIISAIFVYIALTVLMPNLIKTLENSKSPFKYFICHTIGYFIGSSLLIAIAFHEDFFNDR